MKGKVIQAPKPCTDGCTGCSYNCVYKPRPVPTVKEALERWLGALPENVPERETLPLASALGRITAEPVYAVLDVPSSTRATHDGIAIDYRACAARAGAGTATLAPGEFLHCPMGAYVPDEFDTLAHAEQCRIAPDGAAELLSLPPQYQSIQLRGGSVAKGELLAEGGERLTPSHLALMQLAGLTEVAVRRKPTLGIIPVGGDLLPPGSRPGDGQCIECDSLYIRAMAEQHGANPLVTGIVPDDEAAIRAAAAALLPQCDALVIIGGVSKGEHHYGDYTAGVIRDMGQISCYGVQLTPGGKHLILGQIDGTPVIGMPGPPHAMIVMTEYFLPPLINRFLGCPVYEPPLVYAALESDLPPRGGGESIWECRVTLSKSGGGYTARMVDRLGETRDNFILGSGSVAVTGDLAQFKKGALIPVKLLHTPFEIERGH